MTTMTSAETVWARRELHDVVGPVLAAATMRAETARLRVGDGSDVADVIGQLLGDLRIAVDEVRRLARTEPTGSAVSTISSTGGLTEALLAEGRRFQEASDGRLRVHVGGLATEHPIADGVGYALRLMTAECLTNVARHARASWCHVRLSDENRHGLRLEISDNGVGIEPTAQAGTGVASMARRIEGFGGTLQVQGRRPRGTSVVASVPAA